MSSATSGDRDSTITTEDFINHPDVINCIDQLNNFFSQAGHPFIVSDVYDDDGNQYVNLVQKGGGVLGVALVGYTYILEKMGVRFVRLAGTSAGAINTALMTVIGEKRNAKSIPILEAICELDFFKLVDGHPAARWIIKNFITHEDFTFKVKKWIKRSLLIGVILFVADYIFLGLQHSVPSMAILTQIVYVLSGLYVFAISLILFYSSRLLRRLKTSGFGINPGNYFYDWIKAQMISHGVHTVSDLNLKAILNS